MNRGYIKLQKISRILIGIVLISIMLVDCGYAKRISISNHVDHAEIFETSEIFNVAIAGRALFVYYNKIEPNYQRIKGDKYHKDYWVPIKEKAYTSFHFKTQEASIKEYEYIMRILLSE